MTFWRMPKCPGGMLRRRESFCLGSVRWDERAGPCGTGGETGDSGGNTRTEATGGRTGL